MLQIRLSPASISFEGSDALKQKTTTKRSSLVVFVWQHLTKN